MTAVETRTVAEILEKALDGERISDDEAVALLRSRELVPVGRVADELRNRKVDPDRITFIVDRNLNYTNICVTDCDFCAFYRSPGDRNEGYLLPKPVIFKKIEETLAIGGTGVLMQGGHHPDLGVDYYEDLFSSIKQRYKIHLHALSPPEIQHIARRSKLTVWETLSRLRDSGLDSVPGGGGEILVDRVREIIAPKKTKSSEWLDVMRHAHKLGMSTTATMMYGHVETVEERVEHMRRIRELQDETRGFRAFISWTFQRDGNRLDDVVRDEDRPTSFDYLLTQAVSRIYLDNVDHIQSSWVTQGLKIGQVALGFGADDMGSVMIEENVVSAAGTTYRTSTEELVHLIRSLGKTPGAARHALPRGQGLLARRRPKRASALPATSAAPVTSTTPNRPPSSLAAGASRTASMSSISPVSAGTVPSRSYTCWLWRTSVPSTWPSMSVLVAPTLSPSSVMIVPGRLRWNSSSRAAPTALNWGSSGRIATEMPLPRPSRWLTASACCSDTGAAESNEIGTLIQSHDRSGNRGARVVGLRYAGDGEREEDAERPGDDRSSAQRSPLLRRRWRGRANARHER